MKFDIFQEIAFQALQTGGRQLFLLTGDGGLGKSTALLSLGQKLNSIPSQVGKPVLVPIYIPLAACSSEGEDLLFRYIYSMLPIKASDPKLFIENLKKVLADDGFHFVLLLDGQNEYSNFSYSLVGEIRRLESEYPRVSIILTGRGDCPDFSDWTHYQLQPLDHDTVSVYLPESDRSPAMLDLLCNPFYLSRYLKLTDKGQNPIGRSLTRYSLLKQYIEWSAGKVQAAMAHPDLNPMREINRMSAKVFSLAIAHKMTFVSGTLCPDSICEKLLQPLGLIRELGMPGSGRWIFSHEIERDFLAATALVSAYDFSRDDQDGIDHLMQLLSQPLPPDVLHLFADYLRETTDELEGSLQWLNKASEASWKTNAALQQNMIRLLTELGSCLSGFNLSGRDLSRASFAPFDQLLDVDFTDCKISPETFSFPGNSEYSGSGRWLFFHGTNHTGFLAMFWDGHLRILNAKTGETLYIGPHLDTPDLFEQVDSTHLLLAWYQYHQDSIKIYIFNVENQTVSDISDKLLSTLPLGTFEGLVHDLAYGSHKLYLNMRKEPDTLYVIDIDQGYLGTINALFFPPSGLVFADGESPLAPGTDGSVPLCQPGVYRAVGKSRQPHMFFLPKDLLEQERKFRLHLGPCPHSLAWYELLVSQQETTQSFLPFTGTSTYSNSTMFSVYLKNIDKNIVIYRESSTTVCFSTVNMTTFRFETPFLSLPLSDIRNMTIVGASILVTAADGVYLVSLHKDLSASKVICLSSCAVLSGIPNENIQDFLPDTFNNKLYLWLNDSILCLDWKELCSLWRKPLHTSWMSKNLNYNMWVANADQHPEDIVSYITSDNGNVYEFTKKAASHFQLSNVVHKLDHQRTGFQQAFDFLVSLAKKDLLIAFKTTSDNQFCAISRSASASPAYTLHLLRSDEDTLEKKSVDLPGVGYLNMGFSGNEIWAISHDGVSGFSLQGLPLWSCDWSYPLIGRDFFGQSAFGTICGSGAVAVLEKSPRTTCIRFFFRDSWTGKVSEQSCTIDPCSISSAFFENILCLTDMDAAAIVSAPRCGFSELNGFHFTKLPDGSILPEFRIMPLADFPGLLSMLLCCTENPTNGFSHEVTGSRFNNVKGLNNRERELLSQYGAASV